MEAVWLRVKDIDFDDLSVMVWQGKANKSRRVALAMALTPSLKQQLTAVQFFWQADFPPGAATQ